MKVHCLTNKLQFNPMSDKDSCHNAHDRALRKQFTTIHRRAADSQNFFYLLWLPNVDITTTYQTWFYNHGYFWFTVMSVLQMCLNVISSTDLSKYEVLRRLFTYLQSHAQVTGMQRKRLQWLSNTVCHAVPSTTTKLATVLYVNSCTHHWCCLAADA